MENRNPGRWAWILLMALATAWYAWPQFLYSLFPIYDILRYLFPGWAAALLPWIEALRQGIR